MCRFHRRRRIRFAYDDSPSTLSLIGAILREARRLGNAESVARHLVGATLEVRFPHLPISNHAECSSDESNALVGDFHVGDTVFHVTAAPWQPVFDKCSSNIAAGARVFLLVPESILQGARMLGEPIDVFPMTIESVESFVANTIEMIGEFAHIAIKNGLRRLIETYNPTRWLCGMR